MFIYFFWPVHAKCTPIKFYIFINISEQLNVHKKQHIVNIVTLHNLVTKSIDDNDQSNGMQQQR